MTECVTILRAASFRPPIVVMVNDHEHRCAALCLLYTRGPDHVTLLNKLVTNKPLGRREEMIEELASRVDLSEQGSGATVIRKKHIPYGKPKESQYPAQKQ